MTTAPQLGPYAFRITIADWPRGDSTVDSRTDARTRRTALLAASCVASGLHDP